MSSVEFKARTEKRMINGLVVLFTEEIDIHNSKILAMTLNGKGYVVGRCDHRTENIIMSGIKSFPERDESKAIQYFVSIKSEESLNVAK